MGELERPSRGLLQDVRALIEAARGRVALAANAGLVMLYWSIGRRIRTEILKNKRADYGQKIVSTLSKQLTQQYGSQFQTYTLFRMVEFATIYQDEQIVVTLLRQLGWSHFLALLPIKDPLKRDFYAEMCRIERWSVRTLRQKIGSMLYERTALSKKPAKLAAIELKKLREEDKLTPDLVFRDPYFLDFLGLKGAYQEKDLEAAIGGQEEVELLRLDESGIRVAEYMTQLPPRKMLEGKLRQALASARERLESAARGGKVGK